MNRFTTLSFAVVVSFATTQRLPAPIQEESATPKPKAVAKKKSEDEGRAKPQAKQSPFAQFAGVWTGTSNGRAVFDNGLDSGPVSTAITVRISNDGTAQVVSAGATGQNYKGSASSDGHALIWQIQYSDSNGTARGQISLRLTGPKNALYKSDIIMTLNVGGKGVLSGSATLTKQ